MTADANVIVNVTDPDRLRAGTHPLAPFAVDKLLIYRYTTEAAARADTNGIGGTLVSTFTLVASSAEVADPNVAGPYRWGYYDASQGADSWYRYLFADATIANVSQLSEPWQSDDRDQTALRDILYESGGLLGETVLRGTASAGSTATVTCVALFKSSFRDAAYYVGWALMVTQDAGGAGAAPELEEAYIASVDITTGIATLDRALTTAIASGDVFLISAYLAPSQMVRIVNWAREELKMEQTVDVAVTATENRYPAPAGVEADTDILEALGVSQYANSNREDTWPIDAHAVSDGQRVWVETDAIVGTNVMRLRVLRSFRTVEGPLTLMSDTTSQLAKWWRPVFAYRFAEWLLKSDPEEPEFQRLVSDLEGDAAKASGTWAPKITRRITSGGGRKVKPGPAWQP